MYKTVPVLREMEVGKTEVKVSFQTYLDYHLEEVTIRPSTIEVKLVKDSDVIVSEFALPTTIDNSCPSVNWRHVDGGDVVELIVSRALKTLPGLHPRSGVRKRNPLRNTALIRVRLVAG